MTLNRCPFVLISLSCFILLTACKQDGEGIGPVSKDKITGFVQKGPFISGTEIVLYELTENLEQTGKSFVSTITDDRGTFQFNNVALSSPFALVSASGYYFNEYTGELSSSTLQLNAILDLRDVNAININLLTHLERPRVEYLVGEGLIFADAKKTAQQEIFKVLNFPETAMQSSESLDISRSGEGNAMLLAASVILQGQLTVAEMTQLLSGISSELQQDGVVSPDSKILATLKENVLRVLLELPEVRQNITERYAELGDNAAIPEFEDFVRTFLGEVVRDFDGNSYATVSIGNQVWTVENLRSTHYKNGSPIPNIIDGNEWSVLTTGAYTDYGADGYNQFESSPKFGKLYNGYAVSSSEGLCPSGWHVPSESDWLDLINPLGGQGQSPAGTRLRYWTGWLRDVIPFTGYQPAETNSTGFSAIPGGKRNENSGYDSKEVYGIYWGSTTSGDMGVWFGLDTELGLANVPKNYGLSVRCVKD
jgi:uncharacterized protein (TIGR02145 family)